MIQTETISQNIRLLPEHLIDQIKAGEVVERPSSLIKELLENSIDAQSSKIQIHIINNGLDLISVEDNGLGMSHEDLPFAFCRHATSKIQNFEDLFKLRSYGFRGEALASIASSSKLSCQSIQTNHLGGKIEIEGGRQISHSHLKGEKAGTSIFVKDLFFNTPARLKFVRSTQVEKNSIKRILNSFIIANPEVSFSIKWDEQEKVLFPAIEKSDIQKRISKVFHGNKKNVAPLHYFQAEYEGTKIHGYISLEGNKSNSGKHHYLFANNRIFNDKALHQSILRKGKTIWGENKTGHYVVFIETPPDEIDVNVHPNKIQVKFFKNSMIYSLLSSALERSLKSLEKDDLSLDDRQQQSLDLNSNRPNFETFFGHSQSSSSNNFPEFRPNSFIERTLNTSQQQSLIHGNFCIQSNENNLRLINLKNLFTHFWESFSLEFVQEGDNVISPLMIGEPFDVSKEADILNNFFEERGFEFERISENQTLLKTIPQVLNGFNYHHFIHPLFDHFQEVNQGAFDWISTLKSTPFFNSFEIDKILSSRSSEYWQERGIIKSLSIQKFEQLFSSITTHE